MTEASRRQDWELARRDLDALVAIDPERWWWEVVERANITARQLKRPIEAKALAAQAIHGASKDNPHALIELATRCSTARTLPAATRCSLWRPRGVRTR